MSIINKKIIFPIRLRWSVAGMFMILAVGLLGWWWAMRLTDHLAQYVPIDATMYLHVRDAALPGERRLSEIISADAITTAATTLAVDSQSLSELIGLSDEVSVWNTAKDATTWSAIFRVTNVAVAKRIFGDRLFVVDRHVVALVRTIDEQRLLSDVAKKNIFSVRDHHNFVATREQGSAFVVPAALITPRPEFISTSQLKYSSPIFFSFRIRSSTLTFLMPGFFSAWRSSSPTDYRVERGTEFALLRVPMIDLVRSASAMCDSCREVAEWLHVLSTDEPAKKIFSDLASIEIARADGRTPQPVTLRLPKLFSAEQTYVQDVVSTLFALAHPTLRTTALPDKTIVRERTLDRSHWQWTTVANHDRLVHGTTTYAELFSTDQETLLTTAVGQPESERVSLAPLLRRCFGAPRYGSVLLARLSGLAPTLSFPLPGAEEGVMVIAQQPDGTFRGCLSTW